jgi:hypothetical protein
MSTLGAKQRAQVPCGVGNTCQGTEKQAKNQGLGLILQQQRT